MPADDGPSRPELPGCAGAETAIRPKPCSDYRRRRTTSRWVENAPDDIGERDRAGDLCAERHPETPDRK